MAMTGITGTVAVSAVKPGGIPRKVWVDGPAGFPVPVAVPVPVVPGVVAEASPVPVVSEPIAVEVTPVVEVPLHEESEAVETVIADAVPVAVPVAEPAPAEGVE